MIEVLDFQGVSFPRSSVNDSMASAAGSVEQELGLILAK